MAKVWIYVKLLGAAACGGATYLWGGFDAVLIALLVLMALDYITGVMDAIYTKTLSSEVGYKGLLRKIGILIMVALAHLVGMAVGVPTIRSLVIGFYLANEGISIIENVVALGVPCPKGLRSVLEQLRDKEDENADLY